MTRERWSILAGIVLFGGALVLLHHALRDVHYAEVVAAIRGLPRRQLALALAYTVGGYLALTLYDTLGCRYIRHALPYRRTALAGFIGYAFSQTLGVPLLSGGAVRLRLYSAWGLSTTEIAGIIGFSAATFWLGFLALAAGVFLVAPQPLPEALPLPFATTRPLGGLLLGVVVAYVIAASLRRTPLRWRGWALSPPPRWMLTPQLLVGVLDWTFAGAALYALLPADTPITFPTFLGIFLPSQYLGLVSHVPGGLGVFETLVVTLLSGRVDAHAIVAAMVAYRAIYYFLPLGCATLLLGVHEFRHPEIRTRTARLVDEWTAIVPHLLAFACFLSGAVLLLSGATPALHHRLLWLKRHLPLSLLETSHFMGSVIGAALLLLARDIQRRLDAAYAATVGLLTLGMVVSLAKGVDYEEALLLGGTLLAILPARRQFYRRGALLRTPFTSSWVVTIGMVGVATIWLLYFAHRHIGYAHQLWWQFEFEESAPRAMRATAGAMVTLFVVGVRLLLRPAPPEPSTATPDELERARAVIDGDPSTMSNLALLGDKRLLFGDGDRAFVMYGVEGRSWVALGDPVGDREEQVELAWRFRELSDHHGGLTAFYQIDASNLPLYIDLGLTLTKLGEEARVPLAGFSLAGGARKSLRQTVNRLAEDGWTFRIAPPDEVVTRMDALRAVSDAWLAEKHTREKGFSLGFFAPDYVRRFPAALVEYHGELAAFANVWCGAGKEELSIDLMRHRPGAPAGIMDFLFVHLFQWGRTEGYSMFNLGMAPLAGLPDHALAPLWVRLGNLVFRHGEHFYNFRGLRDYKAKFDPIWAPRYLASPGGLALPRVLTNVAALVSGGLFGVLAR